MNVERMLELERVLRAGTWLEGTYFTMEVFQEVIDEYSEPTEAYDASGALTLVDCGTICCIAGLATALWRSGSFVSDWVQHAAWILDLDLRVARYLFIPTSVEDWTAITPALAADAVRMVRETGDVDWVSVLNEGARCTQPRSKNSSPRMVCPCWT